MSYALLFGAAGLLLWLILPQLAQSVTSLFGKLAAYEETLRRLLAWVQATFGVDTATMDAILQQLTARLQSEFAAWSGPGRPQAAAKAASNTAGAAADAGIALAASIYLLLGKEKLLPQRPPLPAGRPAVPYGGTAGRGVSAGGPNF